jgi:hypothetical protein
VYLVCDIGRGELRAACWGVTPSPVRGERPLGVEILAGRPNTSGSSVGLGKDVQGDCVCE